MFYHSDWETEDWSNVFKKTSKFDPSDSVEETDILKFTYTNKSNEIRRVIKNET